MTYARWSYLVACLWLASFLGCAPHPTPPRPPDLVVICLDTLRADRLPLYGCPVDTAPFLGELARRGLVFEQAWSPSSWTLPATVSVLTSVHPFQHGVSSLEGLELGPEDEPLPVDRIPDALETLPERLRRAGYRTYGIASNVLLGSEVGVDRGFDRFVRLEDEPAERVNEQLADWADELARSEEPTFLYLHYIDPHDPFHAREPWFDLEGTAAGAGWPTVEPATEGDADAHLDWMLTRLRPGPTGLAGRAAADLSAAERAAVVTWMRAAYDSEIAYLDQHLRQVSELVDLERAVVVVLADHGEEFYEHGQLTHGFNLHGETVRVPLVLALPGPDAPRGRVAASVSTLDVTPTLTRLAGLAPSRQDMGRDLLRTLEPAPVVGVLEEQSGQHSAEGDLRSLLVGDLRLIAPRVGAPSLYDLARDPLEQHDLATERPEDVARLLAELERIEAEARRYPRLERIPGGPTSEALREHLRGIGYLGDR